MTPKLPPVVLRPFARQPFFWPALFALACAIFASSAIGQTSTRVTLSGSQFGIFYDDSSDLVVGAAYGAYQEVDLKTLRSDVLIGRLQANTTILNRLLPGETFFISRSGITATALLVAITPVVTLQITRPAVLPPHSPAPTDLQNISFQRNGQPVPDVRCMALHAGTRILASEAASAANGSAALYLNPAATYDFAAFAPGYGYFARTQLTAAKIPVVELAPLTSSERIAMSPGGFNFWDNPTNDFRITQTYGGAVEMDLAIATLGVLIGRTTPDGTSISRIAPGETFFVKRDGHVATCQVMLLIQDNLNAIIKATSTTFVSLPPTFTQQPVSASVVVGAAASFQAAASGTPPLFFQWRKNGANLAGAISPALVFDKVTAADAGSYTVVVTNAAGAITSTAGNLAVATPPTILASPVSQAVRVGDPVIFSVDATGTALTFQWWRNNAPISGATSATLALGSAAVGQAGEYKVTITSPGGSITSTAVTLTVNAIARLRNISILTNIDAPGESFTMGYVLGGAGTSGFKSLLIRAVGPSLSFFGLTDPLPDPKLELYAGDTKLDENDNWGGSTVLRDLSASVGAFGFLGTASKDSALIFNRPAGANFSAVVSGVNNGIGPVLAEIYDVTPDASFVSVTPRLINVSVIKRIGRGFVAGFVIADAGPKTLLIRGIGPTLAALFGVNSAVKNPQLTLYSAQQIIASNDDWNNPISASSTDGAHLAAAFHQVGAFDLASDSKDAALLVTLAPGNYTVEVSGVDRTDGTALLEIYELP